MTSSAVKENAPQRGQVSDRQTGLGTAASSDCASIPLRAEVGQTWGQRAQGSGWKGKEKKKGKKRCCVHHARWG